MTSFSRQLFDRRMPQILGAYLLGSWAILEFADFAVNRYVLSGNIVDFAFALLALLAPSVVLFAWFHGAPGPDEWHPIEKLFIPLNLLLAAGVLFALFSDKDLGAATRTVVVEDEEGNTVERQVPKAEFRRKLAIFPFDNASADSALDWLQYGIPLAIVHDLRQDVFFDSRHHAHFESALKEAGFPQGLQLPLSLQREIARDQHLDFILTGTISEEAGELTVETSLHDASTGRELERRAFTAVDPLGLPDAITAQLKADLEVPARHIEEVVDLPVAELVTASEPAFRHYVESYRALLVDGDWDEAARQARSAREQDPGFAYAHLHAYIVAVFANRGEEAQEALRAAMDHEYRLAERDRFTVKSEFYQIVRQDIGKAMAVAQMHTELFPDDIEGHTRVAVLHVLRNDREAAIAAFERILELDPSRHDVLQQIGGLYQQLGQFDRALEYYGRFAERFPEREEAFTSLADVYRDLGDHGRARQNYERALVIDPQNSGIFVELAELDYTTGSFEGAAANYETALAAAGTPQQRAEVYESLEGFQEWLGQPSRAIDTRRLRRAELERSLAPPLLTQIEMLVSLDLFVKAGRPSEAIDSLAAGEARLSPPLDQLGAMGRVRVYEALEDSERLEDAVAGVEGVISSLGAENMRPLALWAEGRVEELNGNCERAVELFARTLELQPTEASIYTDVGRCEAKLGRMEDAAESFGEALRIRPADPEAHLEFAIALESSGEAEQARAHVEAALAAWADAEPGYGPAERARELQQRLGG